MEQHTFNYVREGQPDLPLRIQYEIGSAGDVIVRVVTPKLNEDGTIDMDSRTGLMSLTSEEVTEAIEQAKRSVQELP